MTAFTYQAAAAVDYLDSIEGAVELAEGGSQTFLRGAVVIYASNVITEAGTSPSVVYGIALEDAHNATSNTKTVKVIPFKQGRYYEFNLLEATTAPFQSGTAAGLVKDATTKFWYVSTADGGAQVTIQSLVKGPGTQGIVATGDTKVRVICTIANAKIQVV